MAMKVVRQARLELSGGSTPDQLRPPRVGGNRRFWGGWHKASVLAPPPPLLRPPPTSWQDGQKAMTVAGQARPEPNADTAT